MFNTKIIIQTYAKAILDFALDNNQSLISWKKMLQFMVTLLSYKEVRCLINQTFFPKQIASYFINICENHINQYGINLIKILSENRRLILLKPLLKEFNKLCDIHQNIIHVNIISAYQLNEFQINQINSMLQKKLLKQVNIKVIINTCIIDGLIIKFNDMVINASALFQLENLLNILQN